MHRSIKMVFITICVCFSAIHIINGQSLRQPIAAVYLGMGGYSKIHADVFSFISNQAALAQFKNASAGVYTERRFFLQETSLFEGALALPTRLGNFGIDLKYSGFKYFNESQIGLAYARSLGSKIDLGIQFNYYAYKVPSYISDGTIDAEIGAIIHLTDKLNAGIHIYNPVGGKFSKTNDKLTATYSMGIGYDVSDKFFLSAEIVKEENFPVNVNAGIQYNFIKRFFARAGISSATSSGYAGAGVSWNKFRLDINGSYHPQLGFSPGLLLIMSIEKNKIH